ncbi:site-specific integrase [Enterococcus hirae]
MAKREIDHRIKSYVTKKGETKYEFQLYLGVDNLTGRKKKTTRRGFNTPEAAQRALQRLETDMQENGIEAVKTQKSKKFEYVYELWFDNYKKTVKESTWSSTKQIFDTHILNVFGDKYIDKIDVFFCQKAVNTWSETRPKIFKKIKNYTSNVFDYAASLQIITNNPMKLVSVPRGNILEIDEKKIEFYTKEELIEFLKAIENDDSERYLFFSLLAFTGIRKGEAFALKWSDIDFKNKTLDINKTVTRGYQGRLIVNTPKSKSGKRKIYLDDDLVLLLKKYYTKNRNVFFIQNDSLIFQHDGLLYNPTISRSWLNLIYKHHPELTKKITTHGFRHTHASLLFESGASLKDVQERLGHSDIQTTSNVYTHVTENQNKKVINNFVAFMKNSPKGESKGESKNISG